MDLGGGSRLVGQAPKGKGKGKLAQIAARPVGGAEIPPWQQDPATQVAEAGRGSTPPGPKGTYGAMRRGGAGRGSDQRWT